jgi:hypothetical protein
MYKDNASGVWNSSPLKYEVLNKFCAFPCVSLNVLVSFLILVRGVKEKWHVSDCEKTNLEIKIDPLWTGKWVLLRYLSCKKSPLEPWEDWKVGDGYLMIF